MKKLSAFVLILGALLIITSSGDASSQNRYHGVKTYGIYHKAGFQELAGIQTTGIIITEETATGTIIMSIMEVTTATCTTGVITMNMATEDTEEIMKGTITEKIKGTGRE